MKNYWQSAREVRVVPYDSKWRERYEEEAAVLKEVFGGSLEAVHHIGSTSVEGLSAKPIIDILVEVKDIRNADECTKELTETGYTAKGENGIPGRRYFYKGEGSLRSHHVHVFEKGAEEAAHHLAFRDYLRTFPQERNRYGELKTNLAQQHPKDIESYIEGKDAFVSALVKKAAAWAATER
nr:GrpB family protein [Alteribacter natronophilus]